MADYAAEFSPRAAGDLEGFSTDVADRIVRRVGGLEDDPFARGNTVKQLQGFDIPTYRLRIGDYREVYRIRGSAVVVLRVIHRSELERALRDLM